MSPPPDKPKNGTWTDGGPSGGEPQDKSFAYRQSRKAFIAACEKAGADVIGRVHPARGPDGLPLFLDAAAFGPRLAQSGVLVVAYGAPGAGVLQALLAAGTVKTQPAGLRLVLVHGADPDAFAWNDGGRSDPAWEARMLKAVVTELDYAALTLAQLRARLQSLGVDELEALLAYEQATRARAPFQTLLANRITRANAK